jgi:CBS domain-containing protein
LPPEASGRSRSTTQEARKMAQSIREVMTPDPKTVQARDSVVDAARVMRDEDIGAGIVLEEGQVAGILTDRDIAVRAVAEGRDPEKTTVGEICSRDIDALSPDQTVEEAIELVRDRDVRRVPVVDEDGQPAGIVSLGDLAIERDTDSALAEISSAPPNR